MWESFRVLRVWAAPPPRLCCTSPAPLHSCNFPSSVPWSWHLQQLLWLHSYTQQSLRASLNKLQLHQQCLFSTNFWNLSRSLHCPTYNPHVLLPSEAGPGPVSLSGTHLRAFQADGGNLSQEVLFQAGNPYSVGLSLCSPFSDPFVSSQSRAQKLVNYLFGFVGGLVVCFKRSPDCLDLSL